MAYGSYPTDDGLNFTGIDFPTPFFHRLKNSRSKNRILQSMYLAGKRSVLSCTESAKKTVRFRDWINLMLIQQGTTAMWKGLALSCMAKPSIMRANIYVNVVCMDTKEGSYLNDTNPNAKGCWKYQQKQSCKREKKQGVFHKLPQADESTFRDIRRLRVFVEKVPRLRNAQRWKLHRKNRDA